MNFLAPYAQEIAGYPGSWLIPIILLIIISFPPLFGHELIALYPQPPSFTFRFRKVNGVV